MYTVSEAYNVAAESNARSLLIKARFNATTELTGSNIISLTAVEAVNASSGLSMGATISSKLTMSIRMPETPLLLDGGFVAPWVSFADVTTVDVNTSQSGALTLNPTSTVADDGTVSFYLDPEVDSEGILFFTAYCPLGKFHITEATSKDDFKTIFEIVAYDAFCKTEKTYTPAISMPNTAQAILEDISAQCGFEISPELVYPTGEFKLYDWTCREYIGYFAGLTGKNAKFDRNGKLTFVWYKATDCIVDRNLQFMGGFKRLTNSDFIVQSITSGSSDEAITSGSGMGISFENPLMTQETLDTIFSALGPISYTPANLKWRGNPTIEAGDIITAVDKDGVSHVVYVMEQTLKIGGGMHSEIKCYGSTEAALNFSTSPQAKKLQQVYNKLQDAIKGATELLNGSNGGVFEITDSNGDGINDGWIIRSADSQKFIKANLNGIGITADGGATYQQAMTSEGINADVITAGSMSAQRISVGDAALGDVFYVSLDEDGHPVVIIGSSESDIKQKQTNDAVTFINGAGESVASFSITGAEWRDMQQIKYCGFVWTKSEATGNVRFTRAGGGN